MLNEKELAEIKARVVASSDDLKDMAINCNTLRSCDSNFLWHAKSDALALLAEIARLNKVADWLAQAVANGAFDGVRRGAKFWREEAERMVDENGE